MGLQTDIDRLHVFHNDLEYVIAKTKRDASAVLKEKGATFEDDEDWKRIPDDHPLTVCDENGKNPVKKTAAEWIAEKGRSLLACDD